MATSGSAGDERRIFVQRQWQNADVPVPPKYKCEYISTGLKYLNQNRFDT